MIAWLLIIIGLTFLFGMNAIAKDVPEGTPKYNLLENIANMGFWLTFLGILFLIWR